MATQKTILKSIYLTSSVSLIGLFMLFSNLGMTISCEDKVCEGLECSVLCNVYNPNYITYKFTLTKGWNLTFSEYNINNNYKLYYINNYNKSYTTLNKEIVINKDKLINNNNYNYNNLLTNSKYNKEIKKGSTFNIIRGNNYFLIKITNKEPIITKYTFGTLDPYIITYLPITTSIIDSYTTNYNYTNLTHINHYYCSTYDNDYIITNYNPNITLSNGSIIMSINNSYYLYHKGDKIDNNCNEYDYLTYTTVLSNTYLTPNYKEIITGYNIGNNITVYFNNSYCYINNNILICYSLEDGYSEYLDTKWTKECKSGTSCFEYDIIERRITKGNSDILNFNVEMVLND